MLRSNTSSAGSAAQLSELARQDADRLTPGFSQVRHARIMRAVESARHAPLTLAPPATRSPGGFWVGPMARAAVVALTTIAGIGLLWRGDSPAGVKVVMARPFVAPAPVRPEPPVLELDQAAQQVNVHVQGAVETAMAQQQWAGLDQDVMAATRYLVDQVPLRSAWQGDGAQDH